MPLLLPVGRFGDRFTNVADRARSDMTLNSVGKLFSVARDTGEAWVQSERETRQNDGITSHGVAKERRPSRGTKRGHEEEARQWAKGKGGSRLYYRARTR